LNKKSFLLGNEEWKPENFRFSAALKLISLLFWHQSTWKVVIFDCQFASILQLEKWYFLCSSEIWPSGITQWKIISITSMEMGSEKQWLWEFTCYRSQILKHSSEKLNFIPKKMRNERQSRRKSKIFRLPFLIFQQKLLFDPSSFTIQMSSAVFQSKISHGNESRKIWLFAALTFISLIFRYEILYAKYVDLLDKLEEVKKSQLFSTVLFPQSCKLADHLQSASQQQKNH
jgi:hypothetical protein